ncbi:hypothetical protein CY34DRAFT_810865 [Suillus luteus UH-Slu-Lm8-n1]|uniref:Uncharacterized protein n=1 Tax=Suillus luteus UH-Slu-Lm8-n1 TaxID=930992 RepID=A0A0D0AYH7_9AGAM|nr:hypothetical protein CY34DRAFT_810865 [Suillus luteus UH-Slu-Lm8-n1]
MRRCHLKSHSQNTCARAFYIWLDFQYETGRRLCVLVYRLRRVALNYGTGDARADVAQHWMTVTAKRKRR